MVYSFYRKIVSDIEFYNITSDDLCIRLFGDSNWTPQMINIIIESVSSVKNENLHKYEWANEDVHVAVFKEGVFLFNLLARRGGVAGNGPDLQLTHAEFIKFMEDFKKFIEDNS
jgi:hypothetical protein